MGFMAFDPFAQPADGNDPGAAVFADRTTNTIYGSTVDGGNAKHPANPFVFNLQNF
jgi:hypothetical protein